MLLVAPPMNAQTYNTSMDATAPNTRFIDNGDGTDSLSWQQVLQKVDTLNNNGGFAGSTQWRLPNLKELALLVEHRCQLPAVNLAVFPGFAGSPAIYWSSTPSYSGYVWKVDFDEGFSSPRAIDNAYHALLVHD